MSRPNVEALVERAIEIEEPDYFSCATIALATYVQALEAERDALQADAARYRFLRAEHEAENECVVERLCVFGPGKDFHLEPVSCWPGSLDETIDAGQARAARAPQAAAPVAWIHPDTLNMLADGKAGHVWARQGLTNQRVPLYAASLPVAVPALTEPAVAVMPDGWAFSKDGYGNWKIDAPSGEQILVRASSTSVRADVLRKLCADLLKVPCSRAAAPAPQPSPERRYQD